MFSQIMIVSVQKLRNKLLQKMWQECGFAEFRTGSECSHQISPASSRFSFFHLYFASNSLPVYSHLLKGEPIIVECAFTTAILSPFSFSQLRTTYVHNVYLSRELLEVLQTLLTADATEVMFPVSQHSVHVGLVLHCQLQSPVGTESVHYIFSAIDLLYAVIWVYFIYVKIVYSDGTLPIPGLCICFSSVTSPS